MKCENCPLKNCERACEGEVARQLCDKPEYRELFSKLCGAEQPFPNTGDPSGVLEKHSFFDSMLTFGKAMVDYAKDNFRNVDDKTYAERLAICESCEHYENKHCTVCTCRMPDPIGKCRIASSHCPLTPPKWDVVKDVNLPSANPPGRCCGH